MIKSAITYEGERLEFKTGWHELTWREFADYKLKPSTKAAAQLITGKEIDEYNARIVVGLCPWIVEKPELFVEFVPEVFTVDGTEYSWAVDVGQMEFGRKMEISAIAERHALDRAAPSIVAIVLANKWNDYGEISAKLEGAPLTLVCSAAAEVVKAIAEYEKKWAPRIIDKKRQAKAGKAGKALAKFGDFATLYDMAQGDPTKFEAVKLVKMNVLMTTRYYKTLLGKYHDANQPTTRKPKYQR